MKRLITMIVLCLISGQCFAIASLTQSNLAGHGSGTTSASATGSYNGNTSPGSLLVLAVWSTGTQISNSSTSFGLSVPGFTWSVSGTAGTGIVSGTSIVAVAVYYIGNAPTMASSVITTVTASNATASAMKVEFALLEFGGIVTVSPQTGQNGTPTPHSGGTPGVIISDGILAPGGTNLIIMAMAATGSNISAGSGFTLGPNGTYVTVGQVQYRAGYPETPATLSFSGTETLWSLTAGVFTESSTGGVPRHQGTVF